MLDWKGVALVVGAAVSGGTAGAAVQHGASAADEARLARIERGMVALACHADPAQCLGFAAQVGR